MEQNNLNQKENILSQYIDLSIYDEEIKYSIMNYIESLNEIERKALIIAFHHLKTSFNIYKSNGYIEWYNNNLTHSDTR